ncbi:hypothetical protein KR76_00133 [Pimelobacter simplex]|uniref:Uncharacterized protein n=1 Tax=Nocardioides simplex TaxID=2045 RepID=A0A0C5XBF8_NOCSI|nr:hypothetical protein KR76_00133 [Pimelobacter simplex]
MRLQPGEDRRDGLDGHEVDSTVHALSARHRRWGAFVGFRP